MCLGEIALLTEAWDENGVRLGRLDDGRVVALAFTPGATPGSHLLVHLGFPVEVLTDDAARDALSLRASATAEGQVRTE
jgi:hydrogenase maturation factor